MTIVLIAALTTLLGLAQGQGPVLISNCSSYANYGVNGHQNVPDPRDCRNFYSCDNSGIGFQMACSEGTIFNYALGSCATGIDCGLWKSEACYNSFRSFVPNQVRRFEARCCRSYYQYTCSPTESQAGAWEFRQCGSNEVFNPSSRNCEPQTSALLTLCGNCPAAAPSPVTGCEGSHITVIDGCTFYQGNFSTELKKCSPGTRIDRSTCRCDLADTAGLCTSTGSDCIVRYLTGLNTPTDVITSAVAIYPNDKNPANSVYQIPFFKGNGVTTGDSTQTLSAGFTIDPNSVTSEVTVVTQPQACMAGSSGLTITLKVIKSSFNSIQLRFEVALSGTSPVTITSNPFSVSSTDRILATVRLSRGTATTRRQVSGSYQVNGNAVVSFPANSEFEAGYWLQFKDCPFTLGGVGSIFRTCGDVRVGRPHLRHCDIQWWKGRSGAPGPGAPPSPKFTYTQCKKE